MYIIHTGTFTIVMMVSDRPSLVRGRLLQVAMTSEAFIPSNSSPSRPQAPWVHVVHGAHGAQGAQA